MIYLDPVGIQTDVMDIFELFQNVGKSKLYPVIGSNREPIGAIHEEIFKPFAFSKYGKDLLQNPSYKLGIHHFIKKCPIADIDTPLAQLLDVYSQYIDVDGIIITKNMQYEGFLTANSLLRALNDKQITIARDQNPLTRLPGNTVIHEFISTALQQIKTQYILIYYDFDNFKPYNDHYGFREGDRIILLFSDILKIYKEKYGYFAGHIGGDDFFLSTKEHLLADAVTEVTQIAEKFRRDAMSFYTPEDRRKGCIESKDRQGRLETFPLLTVSAAIVELASDRNTVYSIGKLSRTISKLKTEAKSNPQRLSTVSIH
jgi:diguanylate cyclase (GGDEF)-like protein